MADLTFYQSPRGGRGSIHAVDRDNGIYVQLNTGWPDWGLTLCGREFRIRFGGRTKGWPERDLTNPDHITVNKLCRTCVHVADTRDITLIPTQLDPDRTLRGAQMRPEAVRQISALVYRVHGIKGVYTVTIPLESDLRASCTCRDSKTHPEVVCKHETRVRLNMEGRTT